uniref:Hexose transporter 1 n=1 Tax=Globisporangium ultimum (strain ATCC 200006 / CBS 805.95 / DAOM BR144) TaxID=431595 RepID=K3X9T4_GLOUD
MAGGVAINIQDNHVFDDAPTEGTRTYAIIVCIFASLGGLFFGYDQGVTGGVLVMDSFVNDWCVGWHEQTYKDCTAKSSSLPNRWIDYTLWYNMTYNIGCIFGALLGGWVADKFGRRVTIFNAGLLFCIGTSWVCFCPAGAHASLLAARVIQGMGVGNSSFSLPIFGAEMAPKELRGFLSGFMQMTIVTGLLLANIVNLIATGINPMFSYGGLIFKDVVGDGILSVLILSIVNFVSTIPAMRWVDTFGRRQLLLIGAVGMVLGHVVSGISFTAGCDGNTDDSGCSKGAGYIIIIGTAFFIFNFAISWGPVCWIYPAEIFPLNVRAKAVSLSTMANWVMGTCMTWVVKLFPSLNINGVFFLFCGTCICSGVFVYFLCPETKGILLEDIEALFHKGDGYKKNASPKYVEVESPVQAA